MIAKSVREINGSVAQLCSLGGGEDKIMRQKIKEIWLLFEFFYIISNLNNKNPGELLINANYKQRSRKYDMCDKLWTIILFLIIRKILF